MRFVDDLEAGWQQAARGEQVNTWGYEVRRCAEGLDELRDRLPDKAVVALRDLFFEVGRLCRDAQAPR